ncbi:hypothetical protein [Enemella evansiae]|uniref:hypothetical protein n=1 Tax=Enemella evansiae TaxID=2016499 RepID=UPI000B975B65|nr:hypothetical protein [Enemella evansiae]OYO00161.1 hypothetical protein CGZ97_19200 [Enemella evansiae]OYO16860.1 hypothetical protein BI335_08815 [Enemella evansiae]
MTVQTSLTAEVPVTRDYSHGVKLLAFLGWAFVAVVGYLFAETTSSVAVGIVASGVVLAAAGFAATFVVITPANADFIRGMRLGPLFTLAFALVYGLTTFRWLQPVTGSAALTPLDAFPRAAAVAALGIWAFVLGYKLLPSTALAGLLRLLGRVASQGRGADTSSRAPLILWALMIASTIAQVRSGTFEYLSDGEQASSSLPMLYAMLDSLGVVASFLSAWNWARDRGGKRFAVMVLIVGSQATIGLFSGMKENVIIHVIAALFAYYRWRRFRILPLIALCAFWFMFLSPAVAAYRNMVQVGGDRMSTTQVLERVSLADIVTAPLTTDSDEAGADNTLLRLSRVGDVAMIVDTVPDRISYKDASELLAAPVMGFIPRSIWAEKPVMDTGYQMGALMYDLPPTVRTSFAVTPYGDLWWHGGWGVVAAGMIVLGLLAALVDRLPRAKDDPRPLFLPLLLLPIVLKQETDFMTTLMLGPSVFLAYLIAAFVTRRVTRKTDTARPAA